MFMQRLTFVCVAMCLAAPHVQAAPIDRSLPPDTQWLISVNTRSVIDSAVFKKYARERFEAPLKKNKEAKQALDFLQFDPFRHISSVLIAGAGEPVRWLAVIRGDFDLDAIEPVIDAIAENNPAALRITIEGVTRLYQFRVPEREEPGFAAFIDESTLVLSNHKPYLTDSIFRGNNKTPARIDKTLRGLVEKTDARKAIWYAAQLPESLRKQWSENPQAAGVVKNIRYLSGTFTVDSAVQSDLQVHSADLRSAEETRALLETLRPFVSKAARDNKQFGGVAGTLIDSLRVVRVRNSVSINGKVNAAWIERFVRALGK